jgi:hypothetical protein
MCGILINSTSFEGGTIISLYLKLGFSYTL